MADIPVSKLSPEQLEQVRDAILDGYDRADLQISLRFKWGLLLQRYFNLTQGDFYLVSDLLNWTEQRGKTIELVALARAERPGNALIKQVADSLGISLPVVSAKYDLATPLAPKPALEGMVVANSRFIDFGTFLSRFRSLGDRICRVETPTKLGTGFLVGPGLVLTNYHVVNDVSTLAQSQQTLCRFDYHLTEGQDPDKDMSKECGLAEKWLVAKRPYSASDTTGIGEAQPEELDYALLRLAEDFGKVPTLQGNDRGWFELNAQRSLLAIRDFAVVPQHARGRKLEVAWGSVLGYNTPTNRVRYDTRTDEGASGSPCFTVELELFGLHHASDPVAAKYNQAIPLDLIAKDLKDQGVL